MVETMKWQDGSLILLDQTKLPLAIETIICKDYQRAVTAIRRLEVRGAPAIGAAAAFAMVLGFRQVLRELPPGQTEFNAAAEEAYGKVRQDLDGARPTAVNLAWATGLMFRAAKEMAAAGLDLAAMNRQLEKLAVHVYDKDIEINRRIGSHGAPCVPEEAVILTHCNAGALATCGWGTALGVVRSAAKEGKVRMVYSDETRPLLQGSRLTAWELLEDGIPVTTITDNMAAWVMRTKGVNMVVTGADRIAANGDSANKIGTYGVALLAKAHGIPFYIAAPASTFDFTLDEGSQIPIEERNGDEVRQFAGSWSAPKDVPVYNPGFDVTPAELITGIITEYGVLRAPFTESIKKLQQQILKEEPFTWKA